MHTVLTLIAVVLLLTSPSPSSAVKTVRHHDAAPPEISRPFQMAELESYTQLPEAMLPERNEADDSSILNDEGIHTLEWSGSSAASSQEEDMHVQIFNASPPHPVCV